MPHLSAYSNVCGTCFVLLAGRGYTASLASDTWDADPADCYYRVKQNGFVLFGDDPIQLLGTAALLETKYSEAVETGARLPTAKDVQTAKDIFVSSLQTFAFHSYCQYDNVTRWQGQVVPPSSPDTAASACILEMVSRGYRLSLDSWGPSPEKQGSWMAEKNGVELMADDPIQLFGLTTIYEYHHSPQPPLKEYWWRLEAGWAIEDAMRDARWPTIRPATSADADAITSIYLESRKTFLPYAPPAHTDDEVRGWIAQTMLPAREVFVAENTGGFLGFIAIHRTAEATWIDHLYLRPGATGHTVGSQLLTKALGIHLLPVRLYTFQANTRARKFYERHGFRPIMFSDGSHNEEHCPDVLYELAANQ